MSKRRVPVGAKSVFLMLLLSLSLMSLPGWAFDPHSAVYLPDTDKVIWFIQTSDLHIGASGTQDSSRLQWLVTTGKNVIKPSFIVVTGDLTDSTNGNIFGYPNGPYQTEWTQYATILNGAGISSNFYYDLPGNHDAYNDKYFTYYLNNSVQGKAKGTTQVSWTRSVGPYTYLFLGANTADNTGARFSLTWPYGDNAGLDQGELNFISTQIGTSNANLALVFGHHPIAPTGNSSDTYLLYGRDQFVSAMDANGVSLYGYGHTHAFSEQLYSTNMREGVLYLDVASLGKSSSNQYTIMALDCNGISSAVQTVGSWPAVLITAPVNRRVGSAANPYGYDVQASTASPLRALVFDQNPVTTVQYRVDGGAWHPLARVASDQPLWNGAFDSSGLATGEHTVEVQAIGSATRSDVVTVYVEGGQQPPTPPAAPTNLTASAVSRTQINLAWSHNGADESGFAIERCKGATCTNFAQIATVPADTLSYANTGLARGTTYRYRVRAQNETGYSAYSNIASAKTPR